MEGVRQSAAILRDIFFAPRRAFRAIEQRPRVWVPLLLLAVCWSGFWIWYYGTVDFPWVLNHIIEQEVTKDPGNEGSIRGVMGGWRPGAFSTISILTIFFAIGATALLMSVYLLFISAISDEPFSYRQWLAFNFWTAIPGLVSVAIMTVMALVAPDNRTPPDELNPLTLNNLVFHLDVKHPLKQMLDAVDLTLIWSVVLGVIGYREWMKKSWTASVATMVIPVVLTYGAWAALA